MERSPARQARQRPTKLRTPQSHRPNTVGLAWKRISYRQAQNRSYLSGEMQLGISVYKKQTPLGLVRLSGVGGLPKLELEDQLRSQLEFARIEGRSVLAKVARSKVIAEATVLTAASELRVVPRVESVSPELEAGAPRFADQETLEQREIPIVATSASEGVKAQIAPCAWCRSLECSGVDPLNARDRSVADDRRLRIRDRSHEVRTVGNISTREDAGNRSAVYSQV